MGNRWYTSDLYLVANEADPFVPQWYWGLYHGVGFGVKCLVRR